MRNRVSIATGFVGGQSWKSQIASGRVARTVVAGLIWFVLTSILVSHASRSNEAAGSTKHLSFKLSKGRGVAVCDAYLNLLSTTSFNQIPFCGRPEGNYGGGFERLERRNLNAPEIHSFFNRVHGFMYWGDQNHLGRVFHPGIGRDAREQWNGELESEDTINEELNDDWIHAWTYVSPLDINNDGVPKNILIWQGYGATDKGGTCGGLYASKPWNFPYMQQRAFILSSGGEAIDEAQTKVVFGAASEDGIHGMPMRKFLPLADSVGIFRYAGRNYIDTQNIPVSEEAPEAVRVLLREHGHTVEVCRLLVLNVNKVDKHDQR